jgi:LPS sulfotransferase NodH
MLSKFVILSSARSGSSWLVNALNSIDGVTCYGELFNKKPQVFGEGTSKFSRFGHWRRKNSGIRPLITFRYLNEIYNGDQTNGFKLMHVQAKRYPEIGAYFLSRQIAVIHLVRKNIFSSVVSSLVAEQRGKWLFKEGETIPEEKPIWVDPSFIIRKINALIRKKKSASIMLKASRLKQIEIYYEDLVADKQNFKPIWQFLGADFKKYPPTWEVKKSSKKEPSEIIANFEEVRDGLVMAGYRNFIADPQR